MAFASGGAASYAEGGETAEDRYISINKFLATNPTEEALRAAQDYYKVDDNELAAARAFGSASSAPSASPAPAAPAAPLSSVSTTTPAPSAAPTTAPLSSTTLPPADDWMSGQWYNANAMPENFDWQRYVGANKDLGVAGIDTEAEAQRHYFNYGQKENRSIGAIAPTKLEDLSPEDYRAGVAAYRQATGDDSVLTGVNGEVGSEYAPVNAWIQQNYIPQGKFVTDYSAAKPADTFQYLNTLETSNRPVDQLASIRKAWDVNKDNPGEMRKLMEQYGVTLGDLSQATGESFSQLNNWVKNGNLLGSIGFSVNQPGAYDKFKKTTTAVYDPNAKVVAGPSTAASREADYASSQQKAANTFDPLAYDKYKQFITAGMAPEEAFKQSGLKSQYYAPEGAAAGSQGASTPASTSASTSTSAPKPPTTPPEHTYDQAYGLYGNSLRSGDISAQRIMDLYGYYSPEFAQNIIKMKGEIDVQKKAGTADYWGAGNLASPDSAAWDAAFRLAERGFGSIYDLKQQDGAIVNSKTGKPLENFVNAYNHDLDFRVNFTKEGIPYLTADNQKSSWVDKYRAPVTALALMAAGYYGPEMFAGAGAAGAGAGAGTGALVTAGEAAAVGSTIGTGVAAGTSFATNIGMQLGLTGTTATMAGNAIIQGTIAELTGGDFIKGAVTGAISGGALGADVGAYITETLGLTVGSAIQTAIGNTIIGTIANGGDLKAAAQGAIGQYLGNEIANSDAVKNLVGSGAIGDAFKGSIRGAFTNAAQGKDALEGAIIGGTSTFINRITADALKDSSFTPVERRNITNGITTFITAKASGATDEQAFMATIAATGSRAASQESVRIVNKAPVADMSPTSQGVKIQSDVSPAELDAQVDVKLASRDYGDVGGGSSDDTTSGGGEDDGSGAFRVEVGAAPITAGHPNADKVSIPFGYQLLTAAESDADVLPEGAYYDIEKNAWFKPTGEIEKLGEAILSNDQPYLRSRGLYGSSQEDLGMSPTEEAMVARSPDAQEGLDLARNSGSGTSTGGAGSGAPNLGTVEVTDTRPVYGEPNPEYDYGEPNPEYDYGEPNPEYDYGEPTTPTTPTTPVTPTTPTTPVTPTTPITTSPTIPTPQRPQLLQNFQTAGTNITYGGSSNWGVPPGFLRSEVIQQGSIDPLARVKQAQAELEREAMMQNVDPRLMQILQSRMDPGQQSAGNEYYSYGSEDSIDDILGGGGRNYKEGGYVEPLKASGGHMALPLLAKSGGALDHYGGREDYKHGKHVAGEGDGQSDDIPAWLADGEFVFPADVVSALGNGSTKAGTDKLYEMMHGIRDRARSKGPKDLPPPALKSPLNYLKSSKRSTR